MSPILITALLAGCGSLADGGYYGEPLFRIQGVVQAQDSYAFDGEVGVALMWSKAVDLDLSAQAVVVRTQFPARYEIQIFQPPSEDSKVQVVGGQVLEASVGQILLFQDLDGDGHWSTTTEPLIGGAYNAAVLYVPDASLPYVREGDQAAPSDAEDPSMPDPVVPLWIPSAGFHLVNVAPGPFCQLDWESWMQEADPTQATLHVGFYRGLSADWDCDGSADFADVAGGPPPPESDPLFANDCAPYDILIQECDTLREVLSDFSAFDPNEQSYQNWLQDWFPDGEYLDCFVDVCPDVLGFVEDVVQPECADWPTREAACQELEELVADWGPVADIVDGWFQAWVPDEESWICFEEVCADTLWTAFETPPDLPPPPPVNSCPDAMFLANVCFELSDLLASGVSTVDWQAAYYSDQTMIECLDQTCPQYTSQLGSTEPQPVDQCPDAQTMESQCGVLAGLLASGDNTDTWVADNYSDPVSIDCYDGMCPQFTQQLP